MTEKKAKKNPRFEDSDFGMKGPKKSRVVCRDCKFRKKDIKLAGGSILYGAINGFCEKYPDMPGKPDKILFEGQGCSKYEKGRLKLR